MKPVLLVEDDPIYQRLVSKVASELGGEIHVCNGVGEASERLLQCSYSLWVVDVNLNDGYGPTWLLRQRRRGATEPSMLLSHSSLESNVNLADLQPCSFQLKPRNLDDLKNLMKEWWVPCAGG